MNAHPDYSFIVCANRDEFHHRPARHASFWEDEPKIFAGRDLEQGGTWLGVTKDQAFAAVTNIRRKEKRNKTYRSRGEIVANFLKKDIDSVQYVHTVKRDDDNYRGYNAIIGRDGSFVYFSNAKGKLYPLTDGIYALSNATLHIPWPKGEKAKRLFKQALTDYETEEKLVESLIDAFYDQTQFPDEILPDTGVGIELERFLSPIFIKGEEYGTRATTVVLMKKNGETTFVEQTYKANGEIGKRTTTFL